MKVWSWLAVAFNMALVVPSTSAAAQAVAPSSLVGKWEASPWADGTLIKLHLNADSTWAQAWYGGGLAKATGKQGPYNQAGGHWAVVGDTLRLVGEILAGPNHGEVRFTSNLRIKDGGKVLSLQMADTLPGGEIVRYPDRNFVRSVP